MDRPISSSIAADVFRRVVDGQSIESIAKDLDLPINAISSLIDNVPTSMLPKRSGRKSPAHKLTQEDQRKGGSASQKTRQAQRDHLRVRLCSLVDLSNKALHAASIAYLLLRGSPKEFLVTIPNEKVGLVFLKALKEMGTPDNEIHFTWRKAPDSSKEENSVRFEWGELGEMIEFARTGNTKSLRLRVSSFSSADDGDMLKVSSRGLAQAFLTKGMEAINEAAK